MTVRIEAPRNGRARYDIIARGPNGIVRERRNFPEALKSPSARKRWAEARHAFLTHNGPEVEEIRAPTLNDFGPRWMREYAKANGNKPSTLAAKETILRLHLYPSLGRLRLNEIGPLAVQRLKLHLDGKSAKTQACVLSQLATILRTAELWEEIVKAPHIELPATPETEADFYDVEEWNRLVAGASRAGPMVYAAVLLGGDAGLRRGELVALEQTDVAAGAVTVQRNEWEGRVSSPKGGRSRRIPLTPRLKAAVDAIRHLRGKRLLWQADGTRVEVTTLQSWMEVACRRAGLPESRNLHKLRHTFCSHLAMNGVPMKAIQVWAGHADLKTTQRYMHLSPEGLDSMIAVLDRGAGVEQQSNQARK